MHRLLCAWKIVLSYGKNSRVNCSILQRIAAGDAQALSECILRYGGLISGLARRLSRTADVEDATQEIFLYLWRHAARFDAAKGSERGFVTMVAWSRLIDRRRKMLTEPPIDHSIGELDSAAWCAFTATPDISLEAEQAVDAIRDLAPAQRSVVELGAVHGLTHAEIALRLNLPLGTVKSSMRRGLQRVRNAMN